MRGEIMRMIAANDRLRAKLASATKTLTSARDFAIATGNVGLLRILGYTCEECMGIGGHRKGCSASADG
jgi:hypothetical protein